MRDMAPHLPKTVHFVPAHPVAGTEYSGPDAGFAELFVNRWCILTPPQGADAAATEKLAAFWRLLGANVETMAPDHHDLVLAITSHLPHLIAYTIVGTADEMADGDALGGAEILRRRLPRFHPHRRVRSDHVARRVPRQQGGGAGNARPLQRGRFAADQGDPQGRRRRRCTSISRARAPSARASSISARIRRRPISAARIPTCRTRRCRSLTRRTTKTAPALRRPGSAPETPRRCRSAAAGSPPACLRASPARPAN